MPDPRDTPAMRQYYRFKRQHPDCLLFFRIGDFYEMFDDDAVRASKALGLTLTQRTEGVPMAGMPFHQVETYIRRCLEQGIRVAVCDQTQDAAEAKAAGGAGAVIERAVTRVLTPGTLVDETLLDSDAPSNLASVLFTEAGDDSPAAASVIDLSTGAFEVFECPGASLGDELARRGVSELLYVQTADAQAPSRVRRVLEALRLSGTPQPAWFFRVDEAREALTKLFGVSTLAGFGLGDNEPVVQAAGAAIRYLSATQLAADETGKGPGFGTALRSLRHIRPPRREASSGFLTLDATTLRSLEVLRTVRGGSGAGGSGTSTPHRANDSEGSLLGVFAPGSHFGGCQTAMGRRLLRDWLCRPLAVRASIEARQRCVATLCEDRTSAGELASALERVQDVARIAGRLALGRATPRDLVALGRSLTQVTPVSSALQNAPAFAQARERIAALALALGPLAERIDRACVDAPPAHMREGGLIRDGVDSELDQARLLQRDAATWMVDYQAKLIEAHALPSLKVGYNRVFGYYIELPSAQARRAPEGFTRKQTLKSAERYITPELKVFEENVTTAESRALAREQAMFDDLCQSACALIPAISTFADTCAELDVLGCFAEKATKRSWRCPELVEGPELTIHQGRHPVLDELLGSNFVPNDIELGGSTPDGDARAALALITGPNMAGKSTYIRTAALLTLLAHTGSFIPADRATIGITDRIFTRIGADDALHAGQSTFMVEMTETARILNHATARSLIILDEIGRGTSTLDGLSLAWAIAETLAGERRAEGPRPEGRGPRVETKIKEARATTPSASPSALGPLPSALPPPRTLFATHYHELTDLQELFPGRVTNLHVSVREWGDEIVFLHRILPGKADQSYGIHVAKLAGLPASTIARAREVLENLAVQHVGSEEEVAKWQSDKVAKKARATDTASGSSSNSATLPLRHSTTSSSPQLSLFTEYVSHPAVEHLREIKIEVMSPMQAFDELRRLKDIATSGVKPAVKST